MGKCANWEMYVFWSVVMGLDIVGVDVPAHREKVTLELERLLIVVVGLAALKTVETLESELLWTVGDRKVLCSVILDVV